MNELARAHDRVGPGRLVLVVGPSGAGKDTLIDLARAACRDHGGVVFAQRVVTRQASEAEDNIHVSADAFARAREAGDFAVSWRAHGLHYALPLTIDDHIRAGHSVVANVSRGVVAALRALYADVLVVEITAPADVLAQRLAARGRASDGPIEQRLARPSISVAADVTIQNIGSAEMHARELTRLLRVDDVKNEISNQFG